MRESGMLNTNVGWEEGWTRVRAWESERDHHISFARVIGLAALLVTLSTACTVMTNQSRSWKGGQMLESSTEEQIEYKLAKLKGQIAAEKLNGNASAERLKEINELLDATNKGGVSLKDMAAKYKRIARMETDLAAEYEMKANLGTAQLAKESSSKNSSPTKKEADTIRVQDDLSYAAVLEKKAHAAEQEAGQGEQMNEVMSAYPGKYQLAIAKLMESERFSHEEHLLESDESKLKALKAQFSSSDKAGAALPDDKKVAADEKEAIAIEKFRKAMPVPSSFP